MAGKKKKASGRKSVKASSRPSASKSKTTKKKKTRSSVRKKRVKPSEDKIREKAYFNFIERGYAHGSHEEDWFRAEKEMVKGKK